MFVNGWPFLTTFSRRIRMITAKYTPSRTAKQLASCLTKVINVYTWGGYTVNVVLTDEEFVKVKGLIPQVECNTTAAREHVSDIERQHCTIKKRARTVHSSLPFAYLPKDLVIHLVYFACFWLIVFPYPKGISANMSPKEIVKACELKIARTCLFWVVCRRSRGSRHNQHRQKSHFCWYLPRSYRQQARYGEDTGRNDRSR
ncbi:hypothetical protein ACHAWF_000820 [Thalassiosira exigua]